MNEKISIKIILYFYNSLNLIQIKLIKKLIKIFNINNSKPKTNDHQHLPRPLLSLECTQIL